VTVASGGPSRPYPLLHHFLGLNSRPEAASGVRCFATISGEEPHPVSVVHPGCGISMSSSGEIHVSVD